MNVKRDRYNEKALQTYVQSVDRTFNILERISKADSRGASITEISKAVNLPLSTVYRLVQNMARWNIVAENENGNYILGRWLLELGAKVQQDLEIRNIAVRHMEELNQKTQETIYLAILDQKQRAIVYIEKMNSKRNITLSCGVGSKNYIHSTANGKCLASGLSNKNIEELLRDNMPKLTPRTITSIEDFLREIERVREQGYAIDDRENEEIVRCIAAPIHDYRKIVVASISISGIITDIDDQTMLNEYKSLVMDAAKKISYDLGYRN